MTLVGLAHEGKGGAAVDDDAAVDNKGQPAQLAQLESTPAWLGQPDAVADSKSRLNFRLWPYVARLG